MAIQLSDHFNYKRLLKFVFPSIIMMVFTSIYGVVDGLFVSNIVGKAAFAAINLIMPVNMILRREVGNMRSVYRSRDSPLLDTLFIFTFGTSKY